MALASLCDQDEVISEPLKIFPFVWMLRLLWRLRPRQGDQGSRVGFGHLICFAKRHQLISAASVLLVEILTSIAVLAHHQMTAEAAKRRLFRHRRLRRLRFDRAPCRADRRNSLVAQCKKLSDSLR